MEKEQLKNVITHGKTCDSHHLKSIVQWLLAKNKDL